MMAFTLSSPVLMRDQTIPPLYTCDGQDHSPALQWHDPPPNTQSFVLIVDDPDAPGGSFTHWVLFDIPASARNLDEAQTGAGINATNDFQKIGYTGPCVPEGGRSHRYVFTLSALNVPSLNLPLGAARREVERAMHGHLLGQAQLVAHYGRQPGAQLAAETHTSAAHPAWGGDASDARGRRGSHGQHPSGRVQRF